MVITGRTLTAATLNIHIAMLCCMCQGMQQQPVCRCRNAEACKP